MLYIIKKDYFLADYILDAIVGNEGVEIIDYQRKKCVGLKKIPFAERTRWNDAKDSRGIKNRSLLIISNKNKATDTFVTYKKQNVYFCKKLYLYEAKLI